MLSVETFNEVRDLRVFKASEMDTSVAEAEGVSAKPNKKRKKVKQ